MDLPDAWEGSLRDLDHRLSRQGDRARALAAASRAGYVRDCRRVATWLWQRGVPGPEHITPSMVEAALRDIGWAPATQRRALTALREWLAPYFPRGRSPAALVDAPRVDRAPIPRLSQDDAAALADVAAEQVSRTDAGTQARALAVRDRALVEVLYGSGLRRQEACDLVLPALDFEHEVLSVVGKGGHSRTVPMTEPCVDALRQWMQEGRPALASDTPRGRAARDRVFLTRSGGAMDGAAVYRVVHGLLGQLGRSGGPHLLRHAAATHLLEGPGGTGGAHLRVVQEFLGHASLATTERYTGVTTRAMQDTLRRAHPRGA
ncbi:MAG: tyrosine-type recombinase/integrase [Thermoleophilia bacterium]|nr:tyrosine-type recombinase/integrase [Thermoleophilia bacterium]